MRQTALRLTAVFVLLNVLIAAHAQPPQPPTINVVTTAVPFLRISPDARAGGMGDMGIATSPDAISGFWNMGKVAFNESKGGISATYTPWLKDIVNDVYLAAVSGYVKFDERQALNLGLRYFSLGDINFTDNNGSSWGKGRPREFSIDLGYSRKLSDKLGLGVALRYINSDLTNGYTQGNSTYKAGTSVAGDLGIYYDNKNEAGDGITGGLVISNLGSKISYTDNADQRDFIPTNLGLGFTWNKAFDEQNKLMLGFDLNKLLVPSMGKNQTVDDYRKQGVVGSWFKSFGDFPGQASVSIGGEYWYNNQFSVRAGYFWEDKKRGDRQFFTAGVGLKYNVFGINLSYLAPSGSGVNRNPLSNTIRFSVLFDLGGGGDSESSGN